MLLPSSAYRKPPLYAVNGACATSHPLASAEALAVLRAGGSAADACIAAAAVQCVVEAHMTGIGGDCFVMIKPPAAPPTALNGSGHCPAGLSLPALVQQSGGALKETSPLTVTVPGAVDAWHKLHHYYGRLPWRGLFQTAIRYASHGYPLAARVAHDWEIYQQRVCDDDDARAVFLPDGKPPAEGDIHRQPALAATLMKIADDGGDSFYRGDIAKQMVAKLNRGGAPHTLDDFSSYQARWETPVATNFRGWRVWECPPNCQGVVALLMLELMGRQPPTPPSGKSLGDFADITRRAYVWRDKHLGEAMTNWKNAAMTLAANDSVTPSTPPPEHKDTVYLAAIDGRGLAVSFINSIFHPFGSGIVAPECGVLFHNRGLSFSLQEGHANALAPRKRPMHTIIPAIAEGPAGEILSFGIMGGHYQAAGQAWFLQRWLDDGADLQQALDAPRIFNYPDALWVEKSLPVALQQQLAAAGHTVKIRDEPLGGGQAVLRTADNRLVAASDSRKDGVALGF